MCKKITEKNMAMLRNAKLTDAFEKYLPFEEGEDFMSAVQPKLYKFHYFVLFMKIDVTEKEYKIVYLCDDSRGAVYLIAKILGLSKKEVEEKISALVNKGLIIQSENIDELGDRWYYTTEKGKKTLETYRDKFSIDYDF
jgi:predicted transcriptional regulator